MFILFFFSSRRRHTRCGRDWSSDVCSSDLAQRGARDSHRDGHRRMHRPGLHDERDRKSTRLNSSHVRISYAVFCSKKKTPMVSWSPRNHLPKRVNIVACSLMSSSASVRWWCSAFDFFLSQLSQPREIFFLTIHQPLTSTLFPFTTLFR